jgi:hypothetical protein
LKEKVSPAIAIAAIIVVVAIAAFALTKMGGGAAAGSSGDKPPGMPADAAAEFQKRMGTGTPTGPGKSQAGGPAASGYLGPPR